MLTADDLRSFTADIAETFNRGEIPYPVHLSDGNEQDLIDIFKMIQPDDWVVGSWRMHYHALLHGAPADKLKAAIMRGESMGLHFPEHRVYGSAIVGGSIPIALGLAWALRRHGSSRRVYLFCGDMTARTGILDECRRYSEGHYLPVIVIVEDNGRSVATPTLVPWGKTIGVSHVCDHQYRYTSRFPHAGAGRRIQF